MHDGLRERGAVAGQQVIDAMAKNVHRGLLYIHRTPGATDLVNARNYGSSVRSGSMAPGAMARLRIGPNLPVRPGLISPAENKFYDRVQMKLSQHLYSDTTE